MPREITLQKTASLCGMLTSSCMPHLQNHREIEGNAEKWAALRSYLFISYFLLLLSIYFIVICFIKKVLGEPQNHALKSKRDSVSLKNVVNFFL